MSGALISEQPSASQLVRSTLIARDRLQSGMSVTVVAI
jgi:predicted Rossmann fold nucleotide-binding protein DprA/Smf involved in DNA uptake